MFSPSRLTKLRKAHGLTCAELGRLASLSRQYIYSLERPGGRNPSAETLVRLAQALRCSVDDLCVVRVGGSR
jgi:transcriptional regulator with XRE-family HTH domain